MISGRVRMVMVQMVRRRHGRRSGLHRGRMVERRLERNRGRRRVAVGRGRGGRSAVVSGRRSLLLQLRRITAEGGCRRGDRGRGRCGPVAALVLLLLLELQFHGGRGDGRQGLRSGWQWRRPARPAAVARMMVLVVVAAQRGRHGGGGLQLLLVMVMMVVAGVQ